MLRIVRLLCTKHMEKPIFRSIVLQSENALVKLKTGTLQKPLS